MAKITAEEKKMTANSNVVLTFKTKLSEQSGTFFIIWKFLAPGKYKPVYKSEVKSSNSPWKEFHLDMFSLCTNEDDQEIKIDFFKSSSDGNHKNLGSTSITI